jgi:hypothetical protein
MRTTSGPLPTGRARGNIRWYAINAEEEGQRYGRGRGAREKRRPVYAEAARLADVEREWPPIKPEAGRKGKHEPPGLRRHGNRDDDGGCPPGGRGRVPASFDRERASPDEQVDGGRDDEIEYGPAER